MPTKKQLEEAERLAKTIDWARFDAMTDEEIRQAWAWDPDMTWPTDEELAEFDLVIPAKARREMAAAREAAKRKAEAAAADEPAKPKDAAE
ncbi:hypothetical protein [Blastochloris sulfoviridis]|nr:hypothetical protein [Blastochloris sulfoviridis]